MHYCHLELGAVMTERDGWMLPARFLAPEEEAASVRQAVGITDISPTGKIRLQGEAIKQALHEAVPGSEDTSVGSVFVTLADPASRSSRAWPTTTA